MGFLSALKYRVSVGTIVTIGLAKGLYLGKSNNERRDPCRNLCNNSLRNDLFKNVQILKALNYYQEAFHSITVSYLGSIQYQLVNWNFYWPQGNVLEANDLNTLIRSLTDSNELRKIVWERRQKGPPRSISRGSKPAGNSKTGRVINNASNKKNKTGEKGSGEEAQNIRIDINKFTDKDWNKWKTNLKKLMDEATECRTYGEKDYYRSACGEYWYVEDDAKHGGSFLKKYKDSRGYLTLLCSVDMNLKDMKKHESKKRNEQIRKGIMPKCEHFQPKTKRNV